MICAVRTRRTVEEQNSADKTRGKTARGFRAVLQPILQYRNCSTVERNLIQRHDYNISGIYCRGIGM